MNRKPSLRVFLSSLAVLTAVTGCKTVDDVPPAIVVNGANPAKVIEGTRYTDAGATAYDITDGKVIVIKTGEVDTQTPGEYIITYSASDKSGNESQSKRTVIVEPDSTTPVEDREAPVITITGSSHIEIEVNTNYSDAGATATDNVDGEVTVNTEGEVNSGTPGTYTITYTATDEAGNTATETRTVQVTDSNEPEFTVDGENIVGKVYVPLGDGTRGSFNLHVLNEPINGKSAPENFANTKKKWQDMYQKIVDKGMHPNEIKRLLAGISRENKSSGVYIRPDAPTCGYTGAPGTIGCGTNAGFGTMAHENMHGWQWQAAQGDSNNDVSVGFMDLFTHWTNWVHHTRQSNPEKLRGNGWNLDYKNYGLQNDAEWMAQVFSGWLNGTSIGWAGNWEAMEGSYPEYAEFFKCLWEEGRGFHGCKQLVSLDIRHQQYKPSAITQFPSVPGFSNEDSTAIWKVCANASDKARYTNRFNAIIDRVSPNLPGSPASRYNMSTGDCNHDGTTDWVCTYSGPGPNGGKYLWNVDNKEGAYTFILGGKQGDSYAEYLQDANSPALGNRIVQPWMREWQGKHGSCNGAAQLNYRSESWVREYLGRNYIRGL